MKIIIKNMCVFIVFLYNINISLCQKYMDFYLHFHDNNSDIFYRSDSTFATSINNSICINDTLFIVLKSPIKVKTLLQKSNIHIRDSNSDSIEYYQAFRRAKRKYIECYSLHDCCLKQKISYIIIKNYYCTRYFKYRRKNHYVQVASEIYSEPFLY